MNIPPKTLPSARDRRRTEKQRAFLKALEGGCTIAEACQQARVSPKTQINWRKSSSAFAADFEAAYVSGGFELEAAAMARAVIGIERKLYFAGRPIIDPATGKHATERVYSDTLMITLLRARLPEVYDERVRFDSLIRRLAQSDRSGDVTGAVEKLKALLSALEDAKAAA